MRNGTPGHIYKCSLMTLMFSGCYFLINSKLSCSKSKMNLQFFMGVWIILSLYFVNVYSQEADVDMAVTTLVDMVRKRLPASSPCYLYDEKLKIMKEWGQLKAKIPKDGAVNPEDTNAITAFSEKYEDGFICDSHTVCTEETKICTCYSFRFNLMKYPMAPTVDTSTKDCILPLDSPCDAQSSSIFKCPKDQQCTFDSHPDILCTQRNVNIKDIACERITLPEQVLCSCRDWTKPIPAVKSSELGKDLSPIYTPEDLTIFGNKDKLTCMEKSGPFSGSQTDLENTSNILDLNINLVIVIILTIIIGL